MALAEYGISKPDPNVCEGSPFLMPQLRKAMCEGWQPAAGSKPAPPVATQQETTTPAVSDPSTAPGASSDSKADLGEMQKALEGITKDAERLEAALNKRSPSIWSRLVGEKPANETDDVDKLVDSHIELLQSADAGFWTDLSGDDINTLRAMYTAVRKNELMADRARQYLTKEFHTFDRNNDGFIDTTEALSLHTKYDGLVTDEQAMRNYIAGIVTNIGQLSVDSWWGRTVGMDFGITKQDVAAMNSGTLNDMMLTQEFAQSRGYIGAKVGAGAGLIAERVLRFEGKMRWVGYGMVLAASGVGNVVGYQVGKYQAVEHVPQLQNFFKAYNNILNAPPPAELLPPT